MKIIGISMKRHFLICVLLFLTFEEKIFQKTFQFSEVKQAFAYITSQANNEYTNLVGSHLSEKEDSFFDYKRTILMNKQMFKPFEKVLFFVYSFNAKTKSPYKNPRNEYHQNLIIYDGMDKEFGRATLIRKGNYYEVDLSEIKTYEYKIGENTPGGIYYASLRKDRTDQVKFFVSSYAKVNVGLTAKWNSETIVRNQVIKGVINIKVLTAHEESIPLGSIKYSFFNQEGTIFHSDEQSVLGGYININFQAPIDLKENVLFSAVFTAGPYKATYNRQFSFSNLNLLYFEYTIASGKVVADTLNRIYFQAYTVNEKTKTPQKVEDLLFGIDVNGSLYFHGNKLESDENGRGFFDIKITEEDIKHKTNFAIFRSPHMFSSIMSIFPIKNLYDNKPSPIKMNINKLVFLHKENLVINLSSIKFEGPLFLLIQDKTNTKYEKMLHFNSNLSKDQEISIKITDLNFEQGGVLTVQLYQGVDQTINGSIIADDGLTIQQKDPKVIPIEEINESNKPFKEDNNYGYLPKKDSKILMDFKGEILQEINIFIRPSRILRGKLTFERKNYVPDDLVEFNLDINMTENERLNKEKTIKYALLTVIDQSGLIHIESQNQNPSLFTKVFLENEIYRYKNEFPNSAQYIDRFFKCGENVECETDKNILLENLLGVQQSRQFVLTPEFLKEVCKVEGNKTFDKIYEKYPGAMEQIYNILPCGGIYSSPNNYINFEQNSMVNGTMNERVMYKGRPAAIIVGEPRVQRNSQYDKSAHMEYAKPTESEDESLKEEESIETKNQKEEEIFQNYVDSMSKDDTIYHRAFLPLKDGKGGDHIQLPLYTGTFLVQILLFDSNGAYGIIEEVIKSVKTIDIVFQKPVYIYKDEHFTSTFSFKNNCRFIKSIKMNLPEKQNFKIKPYYQKSFPILISPKTLPIKIMFDIEEEKGKVIEAYDPKIYEPGIWMSFGESNLLSSSSTKNRAFFLNKHIILDFFKETAKLEVKIRKSVEASILSSLKIFDRIPTGCFEQLSSTVFPIVMSLQVLEGQTQTDKIINLSSNLRKKLEIGIQKLLVYRTNDGGFDVFGKDPGHSTLTAYGLWEFYEISKLKKGQPFFDIKLLSDLENFLKSKYDGKYSFEMTNKYGYFASSEQSVSDLYITFVLSMVFDTFEKNFSHNYHHILNLHKSVIENSVKMDPYQLSLLGLILFNLDLKNQALEVLEKVVINQNPKTGAIENALTSITRSGGNSLVVETTALATILMAKLNSPSYFSYLTKSYSYLAQSWNGEYYQSTQETILSLMAFKEYSKASNIKLSSKNTFNIYLNSKLSKTVQITEVDDELDEILIDLTKDLKNVENKKVALNVTVELEKSEDSNEMSQNSIQIDFEGYDLNPISSQNSFLRSKVIKQSISEISSYSLTIENTHKVSTGMVIFEFYKPSCYDFNINDIEALRKEGKIDFYELIESDRRIVFYWREIEGKTNKTIDFSLKNQNYPTYDCSERIHSVYEYYNKEASILYLGTE